LRRGRSSYAALLGEEGLGLEVLEETEQLVGGLVATGSDLGWDPAVESPLLEVRIGVNVGVNRLESGRRARG
jgi:hypothetical protein